LTQKERKEIYKQYPSKKVDWSHWPVLLKRLKTAEWRKWFNDVLLGRYTPKTECKKYDAEADRYSDEAVSAFIAYIKSQGGHAEDYSKKSYTFDVLVDGHEKWEIIRRPYWTEDYDTWPQTKQLYPPRIEHRHVKNEVYAFAIFRNDLKKALIITRKLLIENARKSRVTTGITKDELMYHFSDHLGKYIEL